MVHLAKLLIILSLSLLLSGCAATRGTRSPGETIRDHTDDITRFTQLAANIVFLHSDVKEHRGEICAAIYGVADVLDNIELYIPTDEQNGANPDTAFDDIRGVVLVTVRNLEFEGFTGTIRDITILVVDQILNAAFDRIEGRYGDLLNDIRDGYAPVIAVKAIASGLKNACDGATSITTFRVEDE